MALINSDLLLSALIEIQEKITLLEHELKIQSVFISIDSNGIFYTHASSKCKDFVDENSELCRLFTSCGDSERKSLNKMVESDIPELGSFMELLDECEVANETYPTSDERLGLDLEASPENISNEMSLLEVRRVVSKVISPLKQDNLQCDLTSLKSGTSHFMTSDDWLDQRSSDVLTPCDDDYEICPYCKILLATKREIKQHICEVHANCRPHKCPLCISSFENKSELEKHEKIHLCRRLYHCVVCSNNFDSMGSIKRHECGVRLDEVESKEKVLLPSEKTLTSRNLCRWCGETFNSDLERKGHISDHLKSGFKCQKCDAQFKTWRILRDHLALVHADMLPFRCNSCNAAFKTALLLSRHVGRVHQSNTKGECNGVFSTSGCIHLGKVKNILGIKQSCVKNKGEMHLCPSCGRCFDSDRELGRHMTQVHKDNGGFVCSVCGKKLRNHNNLRNHMTSVHFTDFAKVEASDDERLACAHCKQDFKKAIDLQAHLHEGSCLVRTSNPSTCLLSIDNRVSTGVEPLIKSSHYDFSNDKHFQAISSRPRKSLWKQKRLQSGSGNLCHICGKDFALRHYLRQHLISHAEWRPFKCQHCDKRFKRRSILQEHMVLHSNSKQFHCKICQRRFHFASILRQHMIVHSSERNYKCEQCCKNFKYSSGLKKHRCSGTSDVVIPVSPSSTNNLHSKKDDSMPPVEISPGEKPNKILQLSDPSRPFVCQLCLKRFRVQKELKKHSRVHNDERPFSCPLCPKSFKHPSSLKQHQSVHSDDRPYKCNCCSKKFKNASGLKEHMDKNRYRCKACGKQYMHKKSLLSHMGTCSSLILQTKDLEGEEGHHRGTFESTTIDCIKNDELAEVVHKGHKSSPTNMFTPDQLPRIQFSTMAFPKRFVFQAGATEPRQNFLTTESKEKASIEPSDVLRPSAVGEVSLLDSGHQRWLITQTQLTQLQLPEQLQLLLKQPFI